MKTPYFMLALALTASLSACSHLPVTPANQPSQQNQTKLTLNALYKDKSYDSKSLGSVRWLQDGVSYTAIKPADDGKGQQIIRYEAGSNAQHVLVSTAMLTPKGTDTPLSIDDYQWNSDQSQLLIYTNSQKVWRSNSRGDYWLLNMASGALTQVGDAGQNKTYPASLMFAKFSPDDTAVAYVRNNNLYVENLANHKIRQLTNDGGGHIINGIFDWVYEEEFGIRDGFRWSPDSKRIAYWQLDTSDVKNFTLINNTDHLYPTLKVFPYPKAGQKNSKVKVGVVNVATAQTSWAKLPGKTDDFYIPRMNWAGNSDAILIQKVNRLQNRDDHYLFNVHNGKTTDILVDKDKAFLEWYYDVNWLNHGKQFLKISERDGWRHVYRVNRDGSDIIDLTPGKFDIISLDHVDEKGGYIYFTAGIGNVTEKYLYRAPLDGSGEIVRLTPKQWKGYNNYQISADGKLAVQTFSNFSTPAQYRIVSLPEHKVVRTLLANDSLHGKVNKLDIKRIEFFQVPSFDGTPLDGFILKPHNFDPNKKYPTLFYVYGEPWGQTVRNSWSGLNLWFEYLTEQGYIVASIDNRGTKSPRGREWRKQIYRKIGTITSHDQAAAITAMTQRWSFIDKNHLGIWGHSGGGSMTLNMLFRYPDMFKAGIALAPVPDFRLYDTIYEERYMGLPDTYTMPSGLDAYDQGSAITFAQNLKAHLLLVHGTGDDNVHYQGSERLINKLVKYNKQFDFMSYPNRTHSLREGEGTDLHRMTMMINYFNRYVK